MTIFSKMSNKIRSNKGAVLLMFALILPVYLAFCALAIDGPLALTKRARLSDGLNQAVLAIAAVNNRGATEVDIAENKRILANYLQAYMPSATLKDLSVEAVLSEVNVQYNALATVSIKSILPLEGIPNFGQDIVLGNHGNVIKGDGPIDMVFVVDFSRSMAENTIPDGTGTRINVLRSVVSNITARALRTGDSRIGIVPYDIGVPVRVSSRNILGGEDIGCSVLFVPKDNYRIDYGFWADKFVDLSNPTLNDPSYRWSRQQAYWKMDSAMSNYYMNVVLPASVGGANPDKQSMVDAGYCVRNPAGSVGQLYGRSLYSCWTADNSIFLKSNLVDAQYDAVITNLRAMRSPLEGGQGYRSIANLSSIDIAKTMAGMFSSANIVEFVQPFAPNLQEYRAFGEMCQSGMNMRPEYSPSENTIREPDGYSSAAVTVAEAYDNIQRLLPNAIQQTYLIPLTGNQSDLTAFNSMTPSGGTDTISGILRAVPELINNPRAKNNKRSMVIISDGFDSDPYQNSPSENMALAQAFISQGLCDNIRAEFTRQGLKFNMYFVSLSTDNLTQNEVALWSQCVGPNNMFITNSLSSLTLALNSILESETGFFVNS